MPGEPSASRSAWRALLAFRGTLSRRTELILAVLAFALLLALWLAVVGSGTVKPQYLPSPGAILGAYYSLFTRFEFTHDI